MTNRREFLRTGLAASALPLAINGLLSASDAAAMGVVPSVRLQSAVFDGRYAEGLTFAREIARYGVRAEALDAGDVTAVYEALDLAWRGAPTPIAGFTQFGPMFVLERLANERGLKLALVVEHRVRAGGEIAHVVWSDPETAALAVRLSAQRADWPAIMAALAAHCRADVAARVAQTIVLPGGAPVLDSGASEPESVIHYYAQSAVQTGLGVPLDGPLFSWTLVPAPRRAMRRMPERSDSVSPTSSFGSSS
jgi:hypothetical protein